MVIYMISERMKEIDSAATIEMNQRARALQSRGVRTYDYSIGEPDQTTPLGIIESAFESAKRGKTHYTLSNGIADLREKLAEKFKKKNNIITDPSRIIVSPTKFALFLTTSTLLNPGENVIISEPYWVSYPYMVKLSGGIPRIVRTTDDYEFDEDAVRRSINGKTKAFILNNPSNPSGKVYTEKSLRKLADIILEHKNVYLISDEIYEEIVYDVPMFSPGSIPEMAERTVTVSGFSKSYAMTGWRIGYMTGPEDVITYANRIQQHTITCAPSISQQAALAALNDPETPRRMRDSFRERRDLVTEILSDTESLSFVLPEGTFYLYPKLNLKMDSYTFATGLLDKKGVIVTPGIAFGSDQDSHFRISFATSSDEIKEGIPKIVDYINDLTK